MPDDLPFVPDATLDLVDARWWLELRCSCERMTQIPHKLLVRAHGRLARVPNLLARFRCQTCAKPPISAEWIDDPRGGALGSGYPPKKRVPLAVPGHTPPPLPRNAPLACGITDGLRVRAWTKRPHDG